MSRLLLSLLIALLWSKTLVGATPQVAVIQDAAWSPGDAQREGAAEMAVLMRVAEAKQKNCLAGLVAVGDRVGVLQSGTRRGLEFAVKQGVPVVRLAADSHTAPVCDSDYFIDGGKLTPAEASSLLAKCLERYGPLPELADFASRKAETLRSKIRLYQAEFAAHQSAFVASR